MPPLLLSVPLCVFVVLGLGSEPFAVWRKSYQALSLLIPPLVFIFAFMCPRLSGNELEVTTHATSKQTIITSLCLTIIISVAAAAPSSTHAIASSNVVNSFWFMMIFVVIQAFSLLKFRPQCVLCGFVFSGHATGPTAISERLKGAKSA